VLCFLERIGWNPFTTTWTLTVFKGQLQPTASLISELVLAGLLWLTAYCIYRFGLKRQQKTNAFLFYLIVQNRKKIVELLRQVAAAEKHDVQTA
jgi:hypothetical protein